MTWKLDDYIDVAERIRLFLEKFPEGTLQGEGRFVSEDTADGRLVGYLYTARAYRSPEDPRPGVGTAFEPIPGKTPYTRDSEVMNCETSAWGRAIIAAGIPSKKIASAEEVRNRTDSSGDGQTSVSTTRETAAPSSEETKKTKPELLKELEDCVAALKQANSDTPWREKVVEWSWKIGGEEKPSNLNKPELASLVAEVRRWLVLAQPRDPESVPFG